MRLSNLILLEYCAARVPLATLWSPVRAIASVLNREGGSPFQEVRV